jgi:hypothetical protein
MNTETFALQPASIASFISSGVTETAAAADRAFARNIKNPGSLSETYLRRLVNDTVVDMIMWRNSGKPMPLNAYEQELEKAKTEGLEVDVPVVQPELNLAA